MSTNPADLRNKKGRQFFNFDPIATILALGFIFFISQFISSFIVSLYPGFVDLSVDESRLWLSTSTIAQFFFILIAELLTVYFIFQLVKLARLKLRSIGLIKPVFLDFLRAILSYGVYLVILIVVMSFVSSATNIDTQQEQQIGFEAAQKNLDLLLVFLSLAIFVPFAEELMFRGVLFSSLRAKYNFYISVVITSILFGVAHLQFGSGAPLLWSVAIDTFILSAILCFLRERYNSIWPSVFLHAFKNSVAFLFLFGSRLF